ncbi:MAG: hypothetical protein ACE365_08100 [Gammaproteobacteria bacterium]
MAKKKLDKSAMKHVSGGAGSGGKRKIISDKPRKDRGNYPPRPQPRPGPKK